MAIEFFLMEGQQKLLPQIEKYEEKILPVLKELHPRLYCLCVCKDEADVIKYLLKNSQDDSDAMNFLLKHIEMLSEEDVKQLSSNTSEAKVIRLIKNKEACDLKPTLSNQLLVYQAARKNQIDFSKLDQKFRAVEAVLKPKDE